MRHILAVLTFSLVAVVLGAPAVFAQAGNLGYNSYEGYMSRGQGLSSHFGPGPGYGTPSGAFGDYQNAGDYFRRYMPEGQWGTYGYGTGHMGQGYGPYIFSRRNGPSPPGMFDPLPSPYFDAPPPRIKVGHGKIDVSIPNNLPGVQQVTITLLAFNGAELCTMCLQHPPWDLSLPVMDGGKNVRVRIDYCNQGLSATSYAL